MEDKMKIRKPLTQDEIFAVMAAWKSGRPAKDITEEFDIKIQTARRLYFQFSQGWDGQRVRHDPSINLPKPDRKPAAPEQKFQPRPHAMPWCTYARLTGGRA